MTMATDLAAPARPIRLEPSQAILLALLAAEVAVFAAIGTNFFTLGQRLRGPPAERRDRPARGGADAGDRQRRDRPVGRLADGPLGRRSSASSGATPGLPIARGGAADARRRGRWRAA